MLNNLKPLILLFLSAISYTSFAQTGHEVGLYTGPVQMRGDFGLRGDHDTNKSNIGFGIGLMYDLNPMEWGRGFSKFGKHFLEHSKLRADIAYNKTSMKHYGKFVAPDRISEDSEKLRAQRGTSSNFDFGINYEYYPLSLMHFYYRFFHFAPYFIFGVHGTYANPGARTDYGDQDITNPDNFYGPWEDGSIDTSSFFTMSILPGIGVRYKLDAFSDFMFEVKWQFFNTDWIDGLDHQLSYNKYKDSQVWFNFGYIYYIN
ncbi:THC0290_0291 family protein [Formosa sp. S-31]|uniref:THC0290_0291 family protein n=1 Tax=Formosa sp. S-31 TaxID=2790949 RepID=UPI003EBF6981